MSVHNWHCQSTRCNLESRDCVTNSGIVSSPRNTSNKCGVSMLCDEDL